MASAPTTLGGWGTRTGGAAWLPARVLHFGDYTNLIGESGRWFELLLHGRSESMRAAGETLAADALHMVLGGSVLAGGRGVGAGDFAGAGARLGSVAAVEMVVGDDVAEGRARLNFSTWGQPTQSGEGRPGRQPDVGDLVRTVDNGSMPPLLYLRHVQSAALTPQEQQQLVQGFTATFQEIGRRTDDNADGGRSKFLSIVYAAAYLSISGKKS